VTLRGAPPLGILRELPRQTHELTLERNEWLLLYTDGLVESFDPEENPLDRSGVKLLLREKLAGPAEVIDRLTVGERAHRRTAQPSDDLTMLVFGFR
jgi:serine phosphatase RsbU (regulator of sigma subunit)